MNNIGKDLKFVLIGGGSYGWTHRLVTDIACLPCLHGMHIVLHDINPETLQVTLPLCQMISDRLQADLRLEASADLEGSLPGADFVGLTISTAGENGNSLDHSIPARYGLHQSVGDTVGPGGWSRALRNIPVVVDIIRKTEQHAPNAWFMNYSNPMTVLTRTMQKVSSVKTIGLCHELQGFLLHAAYYFGVDWEKDIQVTMAGINHLIWVLSMDVQGKDGMEMFKQNMPDPENFKPVNDQGIPEELVESGGVAPNQRIKFDIFKRTGHLTVAGDSHIAEFFSHYLRDRQTAEAWKVGEDSHTFAHVRGCEARRKNALDLLNGKRKLFLKHSHEHASKIIAALSGGMDSFISPVNTANIGQVDNLPREVVIETLVLVNKMEITPLSAGNLPAYIQLQLMRHIPTQEMIVEAGLTGNRKLAIQALSCDPLIPDPDIAQKIADDVFQEFKEWLPQFNGKWRL